MEITLKISDIEGKMLLDLIAKSDPFGFYCASLYRKIVKQYNDSVLPQGNLQPSGFNGSEERMISEIEKAIKAES